jgi:hypothetical protein
MCAFQQLLLLVLLLLQWQCAPWLQVADQQHQPVDEHWQQRWLAYRSNNSTSNLLADSEPPTMKLQNRVGQRPG